MDYSQQELNEQWRILKERPTSDYAEARINVDSDLIQGLEFDVPVTFDAAVNTNRVIVFTRIRESLDAEWGMWEQGYRMSV